MIIWIAVLGISWGIASDLMGSSKSCRFNSVVGWLTNKLKRLVRARKKPVIRVFNEDEIRKWHPFASRWLHKTGERAACSDLIETGFAYRKELMKDPDIRTVEVALMGTHLVLIAYKEEEH